MVSSFNPHSSSTSRRAQAFIFSPGSCLPLGRSHLRRRNMKRYSPLLLVTNPPPALIGVRREPNLARADRGLSLFM